jgi:predicted Rossmann fold nucleotide-binding protein DprA/Smf involved in DNA uptake
MAIPGPVGPAFHKGSNMLIRDGACVVLEPADIHAALNLPRVDPEGAAPGMKSSSTDPMNLILETCRHEALTLESLVARTRIPFGEMLWRVSRLETEGWIERVPGARFIRKRSPHRYRAKA